MITARQWVMVNYCEQYWYTFKRFPTAQQIYENVDEYDSVQTIGRDLQTTDVKKQLELRGIDYDSSPVENDSKTKRGLPPRKNARLTEQQIATIHVLLNPADNRSIPKKLAEMGTTETQFQGWIQNPKFMKYYKDRAEDMLQQGLPAAHVALIQQAQRGNLRAIEFYYKLTGYYTGTQSEELMNMKLFISKVVEIIQKNVEDPNIIKAINIEMLSLVGGGSDFSNGPSPVAKDFVVGEIEYGDNA